MRLYLHFQQAPRWCSDSKIQLLWMTRTWHISESPTCLCSVLSLASPRFHRSPLQFLLPVFGTPLTQLFGFFLCLSFNVTSSEWLPFVTKSKFIPLTTRQANQPGVRCWAPGWWLYPEDWGTGGLVSQRTDDDINKWKVGLKELLLLKWHYSR